MTPYRSIMLAGSQIAVLGGGGRRLYRTCCMQANYVEKFVVALRQLLAEVCMFGGQKPQPLLRRRKASTMSDAVTNPRHAVDAFKG